MARKVRGGTGRTSVSATVALTAIMLALPATALALPSETSDDTSMVDGGVRAIEQVGTNIWLGSRISQVKNATARSWATWVT
jgi:hypothetical protein